MEVGGREEVVVVGGIKVEEVKVGEREEVGAAAAGVKDGVVDEE